MITNNYQLNYSYINTNFTNFKGYTCVTNVAKNISPLKICISESHLMRNLDSTIFAREYLSKNFKEGGKILVPGCSLCEGYTWASLFNKLNQNKLYKIVATDIVTDVINDAKKGLLPIGNFKYNKVDYTENYLIKTSIFEALSKNKKEAKNAFKECFIKETNSTTINSDMANIKNTKTNYYKAKEEFFKDVLTFNVENVFDIDKVNPPTSAIAISFRNALYHILGTIDESEFCNANIKEAENLFKKFHSVLKKDGLFLLGELPTEHLASSSRINEKWIPVEYDIKKTCTTVIHDLLRKTGFEPLFYEDSILNVYLPTVWKKL